MPATRRASAIVALLAPVAVLALSVVVLLRRPLLPLAALVCFSLGSGEGSGRDGASTPAADRS